MRKSQHLQPPAALILLLLISCHLAAASDSAADLTGHLKPFGAQGPISEIEHVDGFLSPKEFLNNYVALNRPVLFKGAAKSSPAFTKWTDEYLMQKTPPRPAGDVHFEFGKKENRSESQGFVHLKDFLRVYNTSNIYMVDSVPEFLFEDLILPFSLQCRWFMAGGIEKMLAWFSSGGTSSVIHYDAFENINCLFRGRKAVVLLNTTRYRKEVDQIIDYSDQSMSSADVDKIDLNARPEFKSLEFHAAQMETGDCLYIPHLWVHQVRSFGSNLAVNLWWPLKNDYDMTGCLEKFNPAFRFDRLYFGSQMRSAKADLKLVRDFLGSNLHHLPATEADVLSLLSIGDPDGISATWPQFPNKVKSLFKALDLDKDGLLTGDELKAEAKAKTSLHVRKLTLDYNVEVFAMHQSAEEAGNDVGMLPKLFAIEGSDEGVYAPERTWPWSMEAAEPETGTEKAAAKDEL